MPELFDILNTDMHVSYYASYLKNGKWTSKKRTLRETVLQRNTWKFIKTGIKSAYNSPDGVYYIPTSMEY
jgi:hypothetical protein